MVLIDKEVVEAHVCGLILSILEKDWVTGPRYGMLKTDLEDSIKKTLTSYDIHIKMNFEELKK
jgi:hypothetical protein